MVLYGGVFFWGPVVGSCCRSKSRYMFLVLLREDYMNTLRILIAEEIKNREEMILCVEETEGIWTSTRKDCSAFQKFAGI